MSATDTLDEIIKKIPRISDGAMYWVIRTESGRFYNAFSNGGYISINYDLITYSDLHRFRKDEDEAPIIKKIISNYPTVKRPKLVLNQLMTFCFGIAPGDIVVIPSRGSNYLRIGQVVDKILYESNDKIKEDNCPYIKRRKVRWLKEVRRVAKNHISASHLAVFNISKEAHNVNMLLYDWYRINDQYHVVVRVNSENPVYFKELSKFTSALLESVEELSQELDVYGNTDEVESKIKLSSPGTILLIGSAIVLVLLVAIINSLCESETDLHLKLWGVEITKKSKTKGLINTIRDFLESYERSSGKRLKLKVIRDFIDNHKVSGPEQLDKILKRIEGTDLVEIEEAHIVEAEKIPLLEAHPVEKPKLKEIQPSKKADKKTPTKKTQPKKPKK